MSRKYLIIDGNSLGYHAHNGAKLSLGTMEVQAIYNFIRGLRTALTVHADHIPIVLWDGYSWRNHVYAEYKGDRDRTTTINEKRLALARDSYKKQRPQIYKALELLGITQVTASNMEADDLGAMLVDRWSGPSQIILYTGDKDWLQLVAPGVVWRDFINKRIVSVNNFEEFTGVKTTKEFVQYKALVGGDDNIPGVGGVGDKGAVEFINTYGSFNNFLNMVTLEKTVDLKKLPKKYRDLVENEDKAIIFDRNVMLMDLRHPARPKAENMTINKGEPSLEKFRRFCEILLFNRITEGLEPWISAFPAFAHLQTPETV